jgi:hypothetical protein
MKAFEFQYEVEICGREPYGLENSTIEYTVA